MELNALEKRRFVGRRRLRDVRRFANLFK